MVERTEHWDLGKYTAAVEKKLNGWRSENMVSRLWSADPSVWSQAPNVKELTDRLGWLHLPESMQNQLGEINAFAEEIKSEDYRHVVLLGMGGSSLAPEVLQNTFGNSQGYPELRVLDSTHPDAIRALSRHIDPVKTLFLVSSKSGTTLETLTLFYWFWQTVGERTAEPGRNFVAITDPGTPLEKLAQDRRFRRTFAAPPDIGGRYSALSVFGIVPAALIGIDTIRLLDHARQMAQSCAPGIDPAHNPGTMLGAALGEMGICGRDKLTFVTSGELAAFPLWLEQLLAESTGKNNKGLIPVAGEILGPPEVYGPDRVFISISIEQSGTDQSRTLERLKSSGFPVLGIGLTELADLGREFFRWEFAVAAAGAALGIHPFDQPDVQLAKDLARKAMESKGKGGEVEEAPGFAKKPELTGALQQLLKEAGPGKYVALQAYLNPDPQVSAGLEKLRNLLRDRLHVATTVGFGPRFLHSTGQLHKGGPDSGLFIQFIDHPSQDIAVPEKGYNFGDLIRAQAQGDYQALKSRNRRVIRINLGKDAAGGLAELQQAI